MGIVTVSGLPGSGTSTASRLLAERTGWQYVNAGAIFRQMAAETGLSLAEYGKRAEIDDTIDRDLDARIVGLARQAAGGAILEGRLTGWMAHHHDLPALKVWLNADRQTRVERVSGRDGLAPAEALRTMDERERSEHNRYTAFHSIDISDLSIYDLTLDSARCSPEEIADAIAARAGDREASADAQGASGEKGGT